MTLSARAQFYVGPFDLLTVEIVKDRFMRSDAAADYRWLFPNSGKVKEKPKNNKDRDPKDISFHQAANVTRQCMSVKVLRLR